MQQFCIDPMNVVPYVLENTPPLFAHYFEPKEGRGRIFEYSISLEYTPPFTQALRMYTTSKVRATSFRIESTVRGHHVYKPVWSPYIGEDERQCWFNVRSIIFMTTWL